MGDKRRRGGKRSARAAEENAHRSSRSRLLSPNMPVSAGFGDYGESRLDLTRSPHRFTSTGYRKCP